MTALANMTTALEVRGLENVRERRTAADRLWLRPTDDGWSLMARDGVVVFRGIGIESRRECLRLAHDLGALSVLG
jgi:hypothetical protein